MFIAAANLCYMFLGSSLITGPSLPQKFSIDISSQEKTHITNGMEAIYNILYDFL